MTDWLGFYSLLWGWWRSVDETRPGRSERAPSVATVLPRHEIHE